MNTGAVKERVQQRERLYVVVRDVEVRLADGSVRQLRSSSRPNIFDWAECDRFKALSEPPARLTKKIRDRYNNVTSEPKLLEVTSEGARNMGITEFEHLEVVG